MSIVGLLILVCNMGLTGNPFSVCYPYIQQDGNFSFTQISTITLLRCLFSVVGMFFVTKFYKIFSLKTGITISCFLVVITFSLYALAHNIWVYYTASMIGGIAYGLGTMVPVSILMNNWFQDRKALAVGICTSGTGIATIIFPPLNIFCIRYFGLHHAFFIIACITLCIGIIIWILFKNSPQECNLLPYKINSDNEKDKTKEHFNHPNPTKSEMFWIILALALLGGISIPGPANLALLFTNKGFEHHLVGIAISVFGIALTIGKYLFGYTADKTGTYKANYIFLFSLIFGIILASVSAVSGSNFLMFSGTFFMGFGLPPATVGVSVWAFDFSNKNSYPALLKTMQISYSVGGMAFSTYPGILADIFGSFIPVYLSYIFFVSFILIVIQKKYKQLGY